MTKKPPNLKAEKSFDNENLIIECFQDLNQQDEKVLCVPICNEVREIYKKVHDKKQWEKWSDSSSKGALPPDFFCDEYKLMMDIMRVDDHSHIDIETGKLINPHNMHEASMYKELEGSDIRDLISNCKMVVCNGKTNLSTVEDHNFTFYKNNFIRVIEKHKKKIPQYQKNHAGYKTIFFIYDESSMYFEAPTKIDQLNVSGFMVMGGQAHYWFADEVFINTIANSGADYIIWYTPYKLLRAISKNGKEINVNDKLPKVMVFAVADILKTLNKYLKIYKQDQMVSSEV